MQKQEQGRFKEYKIQECKIWETLSMGTKLYRLCDKSDYMWHRSVSQEGGDMWDGNYDSNKHYCKTLKKKWLKTQIYMDNFFSFPHFFDNFTENMRQWTRTGSSSQNSKPTVILHRWAQKHHPLMTTTFSHLVSCMTTTVMSPLHHSLLAWWGLMCLITYSM
jgi:hypothetical protein